jgi:diguanylate cyclase (GGDEF)-like protein
MSLLMAALALVSALLAAVGGILATRLRRLRRAASGQAAALRRRLAELQAQCDELARLAARDPVTGVWNHRHLQQTLEREVERCARRQRPGQRTADGAGEVAVVLLEIEGFDAVTEQHGRGRAQAVLRDLAQRLTVEVRRTDVLGHVGGTEFLVVLPDTGAAGAAKVAERLCWAVRRHRLLDWTVDPVAPDQPPRPTANGLLATAGIAVLPGDGEHPVPLLRAADRALTAAKAAHGRGGPSNRQGSVSACVGPGPSVQSGTARSVTAAIVPGEARRS